MRRWVAAGLLLFLMGLGHARLSDADGSELLVTRKAPALSQSTRVPFPEAPACATHDPSAWHGLWDGARGCHYDHEHGMSPTPEWAVEMWGRPEQYTGGQALSYPWQTLSPFNGCAENDCKHPGYKWHNRDIRAYGCIPDSDGFNAVNAWNVQFHALSRGAHELRVRHHSALAMVNICDPETGEEGTLVIGAVIDWGKRIVYARHEIPIQDNPRYVDNPHRDYDLLSPPYVAHSCVGQPTCPRKNDLATWSSGYRKAKRGEAAVGHPILGFSFRISAPLDFIVGATSKTNDPAFRFYCSHDGGEHYDPEGCAYNGSTLNVYQFQLNVPDEWDALDGVEDGFVTYRGFVEPLSGQLRRHCRALGPDCLPLVAQHVPVGQVFMNLSKVSQRDFMPPDRQDIYHHGDVYFDQQGHPVPYDHPAATPSGWIGPMN